MDVICQEAAVGSVVLLAGGRGTFFFLCVVAEGGTVRFSSSAEDLGLELCKED